MAEAPILRVEGVAKRFPQARGLLDAARRRPQRELVAVDGVSFELRRNQTIGIVGESGSGKSTLAKCLVRLNEPDAGTVEFKSTDVLAAEKGDLARIRRSMQLVYQDPYSSLNPLISVGQAVAEPAVVHGLVGKGAAAREYAGEKLALVGLPASLAARRPTQLSGGQRQRVAIARAMSVDPEVLIADEPVSALDVSVQAQVLNLFEKLRAEQGVATVFIAHQLAVVAHVADVVLVMYLGRIVEAGPAREVFRQPGHPYTKALRRSQPGRSRRANRKPALQGEIPSPLDVPSGCRFRSRCPLAQEICAEVDPAAVKLGSEHRSWCHFADQVHQDRSEEKR